VKRKRRKMNRIKNLILEYGKKKQTSDLSALLALFALSKIGLLPHFRSKLLAQFIFCLFLSNEEKKKKK